MDKLELMALCSQNEVEPYRLLEEILEQYKGKSAYDALMHQGIQFFSERFDIPESRFLPCMVEGLEVGIISGSQLRSVIPELQEVGLISRQLSSLDLPEPAPETTASQRKIKFMERYTKGANQLALARSIVLEDDPDLRVDPDKLKKEARNVIRNWRDLVK